jgi:hypothetical protein
MDSVKNISRNLYLGQRQQLYSCPVHVQGEKNRLSYTSTSTHAPGAEKIYVTETHASAARSASGSGAGVCDKNSKATLAMPLGRVIILSLLTHKTYRDFRYGFLTGHRSFWKSSKAIFAFDLLLWSFEDTFVTHATGAIRGTPCRNQLPAFLSVIVHRLSEGVVTWALQLIFPLYRWLHLREKLGSDDDEQYDDNYSSLVSTHPLRDVG